jgi:hypothetical protein
MLGANTPKLKQVKAKLKREYLKYRKMIEDTGADCGVELLEAIKPEIGLKRLECERLFSICKRLEH